MYWMKFIEKYGQMEEIFKKVIDLYFIDFYFNFNFFQLELVRNCYQKLILNDLNLFK